MEWQTTLEMYDDLALRAAEIPEIQTAVASETDKLRAIRAVREQIRFGTFFTLFPGISDPPWAPYEGAPSHEFEIAKRVVELLWE